MTTKLRAASFQDGAVTAAKITGGDFAVAWQSSVQTTSFTAEANKGYYVNTTSGAITVTLPSAPQTNDKIAFSDVTGTADTLAITLNRNGNKMRGGTDNLLLSDEHAAVEIVYTGSDYGWINIGDSNITNKALKAPYNVETLIVAGGGAGMSGQGNGNGTGGGGAGGVQTATSSVGSISIDDMTIGLTGQATTSSVGTLGFDLTSVVIPTGQQATSSAGELIAGIVEFVPITGVSATLSVGSITPDQMTVSFSGVSATFSVGTLAPADVMGLTGQQATASVGGFGTATGFGIQAYQDVDTGSNTTYSNVAQEIKYGINIQPSGYRTSSNR